MSSREQLLKTLDDAWKKYDGIRQRYRQAINPDNGNWYAATKLKKLGFSNKLQHTICDIAYDYLEALAALYESEYDELKKSGKLTPEQLKQWKEDHNYKELETARGHLEKGNIKDRLYGLNSVDWKQHYDRIKQPEPKPQPKQQQPDKDEPVKATTKKLDDLLGDDEDDDDEDEDEDTTFKQQWHDDAIKTYTNYLKQLVELEQLEKEYADEFGNNDPMLLRKIPQDFKILAKYKPMTEEEYNNKRKQGLLKHKTLEEINAEQKLEYDNTIRYIQAHPDIFKTAKTIEELKANLELAHTDVTKGAKSIEEIQARAAKTKGVGSVMPNFKITERGRRVLDHNKRLDEIERIKQQMNAVTSKYVTKEEIKRIEQQIRKRETTPTPTAEGHSAKQYIQQPKFDERVFDRDDYADAIGKAVHDVYYQPEDVDETRLSQRERDVIKWNDDLIDQFKDSYKTFIDKAPSTGYQMQDIQQFINDWQQTHPFFGNRLDQIFKAYRDYSLGEKIAASDYRVLKRFHNELARAINPQLDEFRIRADKVIGDRIGPRIEVIDERSGPYFTPRPSLSPKQRIPLPEQPKQPRPPVEPVIEDEDDFIDIDELLRQVEEREQQTTQPATPEQPQATQTQPKLSIPATTVSSNNGPMQTINLNPMQVNKFDNAFTNTNSYMHQLVEQSHHKMWPRKDIKDVKQMRKLRIDFNKNVNLKGGMPMSAYF